MIKWLKSFAVIDTLSVLLLNNKFRNLDDFAQKINFKRNPLDLGKHYENVE